MSNNFEPIDFNVFVPCHFRTDNSECVKTNDDCFIDDVPWSCPLLRKVTNEEEAKEQPIMKKKDADKIAEAFKRLHCNHEWRFDEKQCLYYCKKCRACKIPLQYALWLKEGDNK